MAETAGGGAPRPGSTEALACTVGQRRQSSFARASSCNQMPDWTFWWATGRHADGVGAQELVNEKLSDVLDAGSNRSLSNLNASGSGRGAARART